MEYQKAFYNLHILKILHYIITQHSSPDTSWSQILVSEFKKFRLLWKPAFWISIFSTCSQSTANKLFYHNETVILHQRAGRQHNLASFCNCRRLVICYHICNSPLSFAWFTHTHCTFLVTTEILCCYFFFPHWIINQPQPISKMFIFRKSCSKKPVMVEQV